MTRILAGGGFVKLYVFQIKYKENARSTTVTYGYFFEYIQRAKPILSNYCASVNARTDRQPKHSRPGIGPRFDIKTTAFLGLCQG